MLLAAALWTCLSWADSQTFDVSAQVQIVAHGRHRGSVSPANVVLWLTPEHPGGSSTYEHAKPGHFQLVQKDKSFSPHLLVVPLGSIVDFPNRDPFFHNVFSLFNGKRFDLGLYEAGSSRTVPFDHEGVSYIFCNIHPEMSAIVIALSTPYVSVSSRAGTAVIHGVAPGSYELHVWAEGADAAQLSSLERHVSVESSPVGLGILHIVRDEDLTQHKNKFGEDYMPPGSPLY